MVLRGRDVLEHAREVARAVEEGLDVRGRRRCERHGQLVTAYERRGDQLGGALKGLVGAESVGWRRPRGTTARSQPETDRGGTGCGSRGNSQGRESWTPSNRIFRHPRTPLPGRCPPGRRDTGGKTGAASMGFHRPDRMKLRRRAAPAPTGARPPRRRVRGPVRARKARAGAVPGLGARPGGVARPYDRTPWMHRSTCSRSSVGAPRGAADAPPRRHRRRRDRRAHRRAAAEGGGPQGHDPRGAEPDRRPDLHVPRVRREDVRRVRRDALPAPAPPRPAPDPRALPPPDDAVRHGRPRHLHPPPGPEHPPLGVHCGLVRARAARARAGPAAGRRSCGPRWSRCSTSSSSRTAGSRSSRSTTATR